jgi:phosphoribosylamine--glycine ligase
MSKKPINILVIGRGGREHTLAWKLARSPLAARVWVAPGNGGTALPETADTAPLANIPLSEDDFAGLIDFARRADIGLTMVGPEAPLADGLVDAFQSAGLPCFGPTQAAAQIEASKAFAKAFMARHHIPTGRYAAFSDYLEALVHLRQVDYPVVVKASGLAAGKGVIVPGSPEEAEEALRQMMAERVFGSAGDEVLIEERLYGPEASVLAFCDGRAVVPMPAAKDHKRIFDGDAGPNTGGMGAYAPAPLVTPTLLDEINQTILQPTVDGLRAEGMPYVGVLYAGLMLTEAGPRVLEFNCRFGDPETEAILPLLESDLVAIFQACVNGTLDQLEVQWRPGAAATVVAASEGYPGSYPKGREITGIAEAEALSQVVVFHAGTRRTEEGRLVTDGGRVLTVTGLGDTLQEALDRAYAGMAQIHFEGMHFRRDIGAKALK